MICLDHPEPSPGTIYTLHFSALENIWAFVLLREKKIREKREKKEKRERREKRRERRERKGNLLAKP